MSDLKCEIFIAPAINILDINTEPPSIDEVKKAISTLKNGKAAGIDQIHAESLKTEEYWTLTLDKYSKEDLGIRRNTNLLENRPYC